MATQRDAVIVADEQNRITSWCVGATELLGWTEAEAIGQRVSDLVVPERLRAAHERAMAAARDLGADHLREGRVIETVAVRKDGTELEVTIRLVSYRPPFLDRWCFAALIRPR